MANINKSFNFRNGVQVDNDNFVVNANGLVGIGTSIPREFLDVYGTAKITGLVTATNLNITGFSTFTEVRLGTGIKMSSNSGIITATAFYGNGATLSNLPTSQWVDVNSGLGFTSIYAAGNVGVATTNPGYTFQVGGNPNTQSGVGFNSTGSVNATGIITAGYFSGDGSSLTTLNASNIASGTLNNARLPSNINVSGIITASTKFSGDLTGTVTGNVIGIASTALSLSGTPNIIVGFATATQFIGNVTGIASTALTLSGSPNITVTNVTSSNINNTGIITSSNVISGISSVGISTVSTRLYAESIGVGTNSPSSDIHIRRTSTSKLQVTSDSAEAIVAVGRSTTLTESNGALRHGNTSGLQRYSSTKSLDIINYDTGNINSYLQLGSAGINTGSFHWIYGQITPNIPLMSLTYNGNLGIGATNPVEKLRVVGIATVTDNLYVRQNIIGYSNITASNDITATTGNITATTGNLSIGGTTGLNGDTTINGSLTINGAFNPPPINYTSGISTFYNLNVSNDIYVAFIGINTNESRGPSLDALDASAIFGSIGVGTANELSALDFSNAGRNNDITSAFMLPPKLSSAERVGLTTVEGGLIYNTTSKRLELYLGNGLGWVGIATTS
jgi:hypothetical protein